MKILKFGGTSVANAESLQSVISIVKSQKQKTVVVVSALGGITNLLIDLLEQAAKKDSSYLDGIDTIRQRHMEPVDSTDRNPNKKR
jgi:aspartokinase/homoserine dehydrogenase 1